MPGACLAQGRVYRHAPLRQRGRSKAVARHWEALQDRFDTETDMVRYLDALSLPASGAWIYGRIPKTGTHTVLAALHQMEFGVPLSAAVNDPRNISDDSAPHLLDEAGLFLSPLQSMHAAQVLEDGFRFTVIRNPVQRALSSFRYLCRAQDRETPQLAPTRLRLTAMTGFNWDKDPHTAHGLEKMVEFVGQSLEMPRFALDRHIAPQNMSLPLGQFKAHLTGRTEELPAFLTRLAHAFAVPPLEQDALAPLNATQADTEIIISPDLMRKIKTVFADDFHWYETQGMIL